MGFSINVKKGKEAQNRIYSVAPGLHLAKLVGIIDMGTADGAHRIYVSFLTEDGGLIGRRLIESFSENSAFTEMLYAFFGDAYEDMEEINFDELIQQGLYCYINVEEFKRPDGSVGTRITRFADAHGERFETNFRVYTYSIEEAIEDIDNLPVQWVKNAILESDEWKQHAEQVQEAEVHFDASVAELNPLSAIIEEIEVKEENTEEIGAGEEAVAEPEIPVDSDLQGFGDDLTEEERQRILEQTTTTETTTEDSWPC